MIGGMPAPAIFAAPQVETEAPKRRRSRQLRIPEPHPIVKWAGGKGRVLPALRAALPVSFGRYVEPFCGGAALYFDLYTRGRLNTAEDARPVLCDLNVELIETYAALAHDVEEVIAQLSSYARRHATDAKGSYYATRNRFNDPVGELDLADRAAAFLYLNRTCYNGLWRVNAKSGAFNVPMGDYKNPTICDPARLRMTARALKRARILAGDYRTAIAFAQRGDFVYLDPPYDASFTQYTRGGFRAEDQETLAREAFALAERGVHVLLSNHDTPLVRELYPDCVWNVAEVSAPRAISSKGSSRGKVAELLIANYRMGGVS